MKYYFFLREECIDCIHDAMLINGMLFYNFQGSPFKVCYVASVDSFLLPPKHTFPHLTSSSLLIHYFVDKISKNDLDIFNCCGYAAHLSSELRILCTRILIYLNVIFVCAKSSYKTG